ncbi:MAG TPA: PEGA domain-containing protein [Fredinandcohnia sp.]|nr:PEGA domain-containing protein [Fredinandcohnia sp.]
MKPHRTLSIAHALWAAALVAAWAPAAAAEPTRVLVLPYAPLYDSIPRATGEQIGKTFEDGLRGNAAVTLRSLPGEAAPRPGKAATEAQKAAVLEARMELEKARGLLAKRRVKPALDGFEAVIRKLEENAIALEDTSTLVEAHLRKAAALFLMGREAEAASATGPIARALVLDPSVVLDESEGYGKPFIELVDKVRQEDIAGRGLGELRVDTTPPGALVWVDGREALTSPVRVMGLIPGTHYVTIKLPSEDPYTEVVEVRKDELFHISPDDEAARPEGPVATLVAHLSKNRIDDEAKAQLGQLAQAAQADVVLFGGAFADGAEMGIVSFVYAAADGSVSALQRITVNREMLGLTIEVNKVTSEFLGRLPAPGEPMALPAPLAASARPGAEKINEVDMTVDFAAFKREGGRGGAVTPVQDRGPRRPVGGPRTPIGGPRAPIGAPQPPAGGGARPELSQASPTLEEAEPAPAPAEDFLDFRDTTREPEPVVTEKPAFTYSGGVSIEDEMPLAEEPQVRKPGLLSRWWFWTGAALVVGGAVGAGIAMSGGGDGVTGRASW